MPRTSKESPGRSPAESPARSRNGTAKPRLTKSANDGDSAQRVEDSKSAVEPFRREINELCSIVRKELTALSSQLSETVRHAQEQVAELLRQVREARVELESLRQQGRDARLSSLTDHSSYLDSANRLGLTVGSGVMVADVLSDSPAEKAGLVNGDIIESVNGTTINDGTQLREVIQALAADTTIPVCVQRGGKSKKIKITLNEQDGEAANRLGVTVGPGIVIAEVMANGPGAGAGLRAGDVIGGVNGNAILTGEELRTFVQQLPGDQEIAIQVIRKGETAIVSIPPKAG